MNINLWKFDVSRPWSLASTHVTLGLTAMVLLTSSNARAQCNDQLVRLLATDGVGTGGEFGWSVALSSDGSTALVGAPGGAGLGAVYVFARTGSTWTQQGPKLVPSGSVGNGGCGWSVALSADGNTAVAGAYGDNNFVGAAYVFARSGTSWTQEGPKLVAGGGVGQGFFGVSVSLSGDGNTAVIGANNDNSFAGAAYVFVRSGTTWTQQGPKLVPTGGVGQSGFGYSVTISGDGTTTVIGAFNDNAGIGAGYVFTRSGTTWAQQGPKLVPTGGMGSGFFGSSVSVGGDGNTAVLAAPSDNPIGAVYVFLRSGTTWTQQGSKLIPIGGVGQVGFGSSVALSSDGSDCVVGAPYDNGGIGAVFGFARLGTTWMQQATKPLQTGGINANHLGWSVALSADGNTAVVGAPDDNASTGAACIFHINREIAFAQQPADAAVPAGTTATFVVAASSNSSLTYQWRRNGIHLTDGPTGTGSVVSGASTPTLAISGTTMADAGGAFDCIVTNACGAVPSNPAGLAVVACYPNCDSSTQAPVLNVLDFTCFLQKFAAGCP